MHQSTWQRHYTKQDRGEHTPLFDTVGDYKWFERVTILMSLASILSWKSKAIHMNFSGQPNLAMIFHGPLWFIVPKALARSMKVQ